MPKLLSDVSSITNCAVCRYQQYEARVNCKTCRTLESKRDFSRDDSEMIYFSPTSREVTLALFGDMRHQRPRHQIGSYRFHATMTLVSVSVWRETLSRH